MTRELTHHEFHQIDRNDLSLWNSLLQWDGFRQKKHTGFGYCIHLHSYKSESASRNQWRSKNGLCNC
uniref:Uncharacterized protein n=1 Tax=Salix viminalis TaxID=40686 RepID=A0A6N2L8Y2_SALVM